MAETIKCPKCHSTQISAQKKGFSTGKAAAGVVLTGGVGILAGLHGSSDVDVVCLNCGNKWNPKTLFQQKQRERVQAADKYKAKWKNEFYQLYDSGKIEEATEILKVERGAMLNEIGVDRIYAKLKSEDRTGVVIGLIMGGIFLAMVCWFVSCIG